MRGEEGENEGRGGGKRKVREDSVVCVPAAYPLLEKTDK